MGQCAQIYIPLVNGKDGSKTATHLFLVTSYAEGSGIAMWTLDVDG